MFFIYIEDRYVSVLSVVLRFSLIEIYDIIPQPYKNKIRETEKHSKDVLYKNKNTSVFSTFFYLPFLGYIKVKISLAQTSLVIPMSSYVKGVPLPFSSSEIRVR